MTHCVSMKCDERMRHGAVSGRAGRSSPHRLSHRGHSGDDETALRRGGWEGGHYRRCLIGSARNDAVAECPSFVVSRRQTGTGRNDGRAVGRQVPLVPRTSTVLALTGSLLPALPRQPGIIDHLSPRIGGTLRPTGCWQVVMLEDVAYMTKNTLQVGPSESECSCFEGCTTHTL